MGSTSPHLALIAAAADRVLTRAEWREQARLAWPDGPSWFLAMLVDMLVSTRATPDDLLILADALEEARRTANVEGRLAVATHLKQLADLPRRMAALRAEEL